jgi:hypothetical protein
MWNLVQHFTNQVFDFFRKINWKTKSLIHNILVQFLHIIGFEWNCTSDHCIKQDSEGPDINIKSMISFISYDFRCDVSRSPSLLDNLHILFNDFRNSKITYFDSFIAVYQNIIKFDVSMEYRPSMSVSQAIQNVFKKVPSFSFLQSTFAFYVLK